MRALVSALIRRTPYFWRYASKFDAPFVNSSSYWDKRYRQGGTSGAGSYGQLAEFKAEVINSFVAEHGIRKVIEFGCGDGAQLILAKYPAYTGLDVSNTAVLMCRDRFRNDPSKEFFLYPSTVDEPKGRFIRADLALSLDVIYHLVEDSVFEKYLRDVFASAARFVVIYSSNFDARTEDHVRHRKFTAYVDANFPDWSLIKRIPQRYPAATFGPVAGSQAEFFIYAKASGGEE